MVNVTSLGAVTVFAHMDGMVKQSLVSDMSFTVYMDKLPVAVPPNYDELIEVLKKLEIDEQECEYAITSMVKENKDIAYFGIAGSFMYLGDSLDHFESAGAA